MAIVMSVAQEHQRVLQYQQTLVQQRQQLAMQRASFGNANKASNWMQLGMAQNNVSLIYYLFFSGML